MSDITLNSANEGTASLVAPRVDFDQPSVGMHWRFETTDAFGQKRVSINFPGTGHNTRLVTYPRHLATGAALAVFGILIGVLGLLFGFFIRSVGVGLIASVILLVSVTALSIFIRRAEKLRFADSA